MLQRLQENKSFEDDLLQALAHDEFKVYYQPIADTVTREIYGYEALVRWFHPVRGAVPPTVFIPGGRENRPYQCPRRVGAENRLCRSGQLGDAAQGLGQRFADSADEHLADRHHYQRAAADRPRSATLDLEITESDVFNENTRSLEILSQLREQGIQISIDDFGTGYSSLSV
jgi:EAL domain-containing protein (putative c-di-GMP-specific phosphodiesterase class I)